MQKNSSARHLPLRNERGDLSIAACFIIVGIVMLISFLLLYASVKINCINIRNGVKMEINNLTASIYADTYRSQRESNFGEYLNTLYSSRSYVVQMESMVEDGLAAKVDLANDDYKISDIRLEFELDGDRIRYIFTCDAEFYISMFGRQYPTVTREIELTGYHNTKY